MILTFSTQDILWGEENYDILPYPSQPLRFKTSPDSRLPGGSHFRFLATSCITPNHPYRGPLHRKTIHGFDLMAEYLFPVPPSPPVNASPVVANANQTITPPAEFLLFLGDFIYADVPIYIGDNKEAYRRLYRRNYQSPSFKKIYEHLRESWVSFYF